MSNSTTEIGAQTSIVDTIAGIEPDHSLFSNVKDRGNDRFQRKVRSLADRRLNKRPVGLLEFWFAIVDGKTVCKIDVTPSSEPFYLDGAYWVRDGNRSITLVDDEQDDYIARRRARGNSGL
jgi:hypothetical protein